MPFDFKKVYKDWYQPKTTPALVTIPAMKFVAVRGEGDPNVPGGAYQQALEALYGVSYALRMGPKAGRLIDGYFEYVVPPLEGLWLKGSPSDKAAFKWISMIRVPDFVTPEDLEWARKRKPAFSGVEWYEYEEGLCVQCMHIGSYDEEPATLEGLRAFAETQGVQIDLSPWRPHHEIYLSDPRKTAKENLRTVLRLPVR